jgi:prephenate dehydrogenase
LVNVRQITIIGTGLIGGSFALALRKAGFAGRIIGCDRPLVLAEAKRLSVIDIGIMELRQAVQGSDVILLATPVGAIIDVLEESPVFPPDALITDVGSTKAAIVDRARSVFGDAARQRFLPGHPMAGKEYSGVANATADLFEGAVWLFTPMPGQDIEAGAAADFIAWVRRVGPRVLTIDAARHDRICAWVSHVPQMLSTALAASLYDEFDGDADAKAIGGRALREMTRIAASPYSMWRDIALTNTGNIEQALMRLEQRIAHIRENLRSRQLEEEFERGQKFKGRP